MAMNFLVAISAVVVCVHGASIHITEKCPEQPAQKYYAFSVQLATELSADVADKTVRFSVAKRNDESVFNLSTWVFTAPVKGVYQFLYSGVSKDPLLELELYSPELGPISTATSNQDSQASNMAIVELNVGNSVSVRIAKATQTIKACDPACSSFSGSLLYHL